MDIVGESVVIRPSSVGAEEFSRAIERRQSAAALTIWILGSGDVSTVLTVKLQGSNDLDNWSDIGTTSTLSGVPSHHEQDMGYIGGWSFLRLRYVAQNASSSEALAIRAGIRQYSD